jgi:hypothetical protein
MEEIIRELGAQVAQNNDVLMALLPDLVSTANSRLHSFGRGLAEGCSEKESLFQILRAAAEKIPSANRKIEIFIGFLAGVAESDPAFFNSTLDALVYDEVLGEWFPYLQTAATIDRRGVERFHKALNFGIAPISFYKTLAYGKAHESIPDKELSKLLQKILSKNRGVDIVLKILGMRLHKRGGEPLENSEHLSGVAKALLSSYNFDEVQREQFGFDYLLPQLASKFLKGKNCVDAARKLCKNLARARNSHLVRPGGYSKLLSILAQNFPQIFLDTFMESPASEFNLVRRFFRREIEEGENPLNKISDNKLLSWCELNSPKRYSSVIRAIDVFRHSETKGHLEWEPIVYSILERAPDLSAILEILADSIQPSSYSGSLAEILARRAVLFQEFCEHENPKIKTWARTQHSLLQESIRKAREGEEHEARKRNESFE